jgi:hypothetical protein
MPVTRQRVPAGFRHGLRVRVGAIDGPRGVLLKCQTRDGSGEYWKVRTQDVPARWLWPDGLIVDGAGDRVVPACADCGLAFIGGGDPICDRCAAEQFGTAAARHADAAPRDADEHPRRWRYTGRRRNHS